ncbi:MAG: hypothetical protein H6Q90_2014 [Deltaproteobacteria bacterium]|nr:hypothetical protein [Deltaproteobacteria bacterium]
MARAETCPENQPGWMRGRAIVFEPNLTPPGDRGIGEIFAFAFRRGDSEPGTRYLAVSDSDGNLCIHDTSAGEWVVTSLEPFTFRPIVREVTCTARSCDMGELHFEALRVSDDYVEYNTDWWSGSLAETITVPEGATSLAKLTFRSGAESRNAVEVHRGLDVTGEPIARSSISFPGGGGRATAAFAPGVPLTPGETLTIAVLGSWAPYRLGDVYAGGAAYQVGDDHSLNPIANTDLCFNLDLDSGGSATSFLVSANDGYEFGSDLAQEFVAHSTAITHASAFTGGPEGFRRVRIFVSETPNGPPIGPVKETIGLHDQGIAVAWFADELPVTIGQHYYLRVQYPELGHATYTRKQLPDRSAPYPDLVLRVDGNPVDGSLVGRVMGPTATTGAGGDAGTSGDGGVDPQPGVGGCGCQSGRGVSDGGLLLGVAVGLYLCLRRRRQALDVAPTNLVVVER